MVKKLAFCRLAVAVALVALFAVVEPAGQAYASSRAATALEQSNAEGEVGTLDAPDGERCGAYHRRRPQGEDSLYYKHCGSTWIEVEVDVRESGNEQECLPPNFHARLRSWHYAGNAWYVGLC